MTNLQNDTSQTSQIDPQSKGHPRYQILNLIARGGMGAIYKALDTVLNRHVAIKILLASKSDTVGLNRFQHEAHVVAQLQHPNIPPIYDIGMIAEPALGPSIIPKVDEATFVNGRAPQPSKTQTQERPFLAMKLVQGHTLEELLKVHGPGSGQWLSTFESICQAVGFAHDAGFVHRDLKPSNVMVGSFGEVQVMDWGLAKRLSSTSTSSGSRTSIDTSHPTPPNGWSATKEAFGSNETRAGTILGTPNYMSPEQARGEVDRVDRRSDVFALGAILHEMLTGRKIQEGDSHEVVDRRAAGDYAGAIEALDRCKDDPAVIALAKRCLEPDPSRRPTDAIEVARAVAQLRADADARAKQLELKQAEAALREVESRKRRAVLLRSAIAVMAVLVVGITVSSIMTLRAHDAEVRAQDAARLELAANQLAQKQLGDIKKGNEILLGVFQDLDIREIREGSQPLEGQLADRLLSAGRLFDAEPIHDRLTLANLRHRLGVTLLHLGRPREASQLFESAGNLLAEFAGEEQAETIESQNRYAEAIAADGRNADAVAIWDALLPRARAALGDEAKETISIMINLTTALHKLGQYDRAASIGEATYALANRVYGPTHHETLTIRNNLALVYISTNKTELAIRIYSQSLETLNRIYGKDHVFSILTLNNLGAVYKSIGQPEKSLEFYREATIRATAKLGLDHPDTWVCMYNLARTYEDNKAWDAALQIYEQLQSLKVARYGRHHRFAYQSAEHLARCYRSAGRHTAAIGPLENLIPWWKLSHGADHPTVVQGLDHLSECYLAVNRQTDALPVLTELVTARKAKLGVNHPDTLSSLHKLAHCQYRLGNYAAATPFFEELAREYEATKGADDPSTISAIDYLSVCYNRIGRTLAAMPLYEKVLSYRRAKFGNTHADTLNVLLKLVNGHHALGQFPMMVPLAEEIVQSYAIVKGKTHVETIQMMNKLGEAYRGNGQAQLAVQHMENTVRIATESLGPHHEARLDCLNSLAAAYLGIDRIDLATTTFYEAFQLLAKSSGEDNYLTHVALLNYATCSYRQGLRSQALETYERLLAMYRRRSQPGNADFAGMLGQAGFILLGQGEYELAEPFCRETLAIRERIQPDAWTTFNSRSMLGGSLLGQKKFAEAEAFLTTGYEQMRRRIAYIPEQGMNRIFEAGERLAELYDATGRSAQAKEIRSQLGREIAPPPRTRSLQSQSR